jgi:uncharacterized protein (TIRG00374 family)
VIQPHNLILPNGKIFDTPAPILGFIWQAAPMSAPVPPKATIDKKKSIILGVVGLGFIVLIFWRVIPQVGSYSEAAKALESMSTLAIGLIVGMVLLYLFAYGFPFKAAAPGLKFWPSEQINQAAFAISNGVPAGGAVGLAVQYGMLTSYGISGASSTAAITAVGLWSTFITMGFPILGVAALALAGKGGSAYVLTAVIGLVILITVITLFVLVMRSAPLAQRFGEFANKAIDPLRRRFKRLADLDVVGPITSFRTSMYGLLKERWKLITAAQVAVASSQFLILYVALRGIQGWDTEGTSILVVFAAFSISQLGMMIPITPGGLGTVDAAMIGLLTTFGVSSGDATAAALVWRASSYIPQIVIGIIALLTWYRKAGQRLATTKSA